MVFCFLRIRREKGEDPRKGVSKTGYGVRGCAAQPRGSFYPFLPSFVRIRMGLTVRSVRCFEYEALI